MYTHRHTDGYLEWSSPTCAGCACLDAEDQWGVTGAVTGDIEIWNVETGKGRAFEVFGGEHLKLANLPVFCGQS